MADQKEEGNRTPLKDFTNVIIFNTPKSIKGLSLSPQSGGGEKVKPEAILGETFTHPVEEDQQSTNSAASSPSKSHADVDTTDYESADEGNVSLNPLSITTLADYLDSVHIGTPKKVSPLVGTFPFSPAEKDLYISSPKSLCENLGADNSSRTLELSTTTLGDEDLESSGAINANITLISADTNALSCDITEETINNDSEPNSSSCECDQELNVVTKETNYSKPKEVLTVDSTPQISPSNIIYDNSDLKVNANLNQEINNSVELSVYPLVVENKSLNNTVSLKQEHNVVANEDLTNDNNTLLGAINCDKNFLSEIVGSQPSEELSARSVELKAPTVHHISQNLDKTISKTSVQCFQPSDESFGEICLSLNISESDFTSWENETIRAVAESDLNSFEKETFQAVEESDIKSTENKTVITAAKADIKPVETKTTSAVAELDSRSIEEKTISAVVESDIQLIENKTDSAAAESDIKLTENKTISAEAESDIKPIENKAIALVEVDIKQTENKTISAEAESDIKPIENKAIALVEADIKPVETKTISAIAELDIRSIEDKAIVAELDIKPIESQTITADAESDIKPTENKTISAVVESDIKPIENETIIVAAEADIKQTENKTISAEAESDIKPTENITISAVVESYIKPIENKAITAEAESDIKPIENQTISAVVGSDIKPIETKTTSAVAELDIRSIEAKTISAAVESNIQPIETSAVSEVRESGDLQVVDTSITGILLNQDIPQLDESVFDNFTNSTTDIDLLAETIVPYHSKADCIHEKNPLINEIIKRDIVSSTNSNTDLDICPNNHSCVSSASDCNKTTLINPLTVNQADKVAFTISEKNISNSNTEQNLHRVEVCEEKLSLKQALEDAEILKPLLYSQIPKQEQNIINLPPTQELTCSHTVDTTDLSKSELTSSTTSSVVREDSLEPASQSRRSSYREDSLERTPNTGIFSKPPYNIMDRSYNGLQELYETCSKQERELGCTDVVEPALFNLSIATEAKRLADEINKMDLSSEYLDDVKPPQCMMQSLPAEINNSEAGPITADEDFKKSDYFQNATTVFNLEYLSRSHSQRTLKPSNLTRNSLFLKFDPLVGKLVEADEQFNDSAMSDNVPTDEPLTKTWSPPKDAAGNATLVPITPLSSKNQPSTNSTPNSTKSQGSTPTLRQEFLSKEISKLQELMLQQEAAHQELLLEKTDEVEKLRKRLSELEMREPKHDLEKRLKELQAENARLQKELSESNASNKQLIIVMEEYEKTISQLVTNKEEMKNEHEKIKDEIAQERDTAVSHLNNMEVAFNDVHAKYERVKSIVETLHSNEKLLKDSLEEHVKTIERQKANYNKLKHHASEKLQAANQEIANLVSSHQMETAKMNAVAKKAELKIKSLEEALEQKKNEVRELTQICDELIGKVTIK